MYRHEPTGPSSLVADTLPFVTLRRYRNATITVVALILITSFWLFVGDDTRRLRSQPPPDGHATEGGSSDHQTSTTPKGHLIPRKIWQILLSKQGANGNVNVNPDNLQDTPTWLALNGDYTYTLVGDQGGNEFVSQHFAHKAKVVEVYNNLPNVGMKSDLLRYLILDVEGGVYTDTDTIALKPIDVWVPPEYRDKARLIVGIEFDRRDGGAWADIPHWLQFCQWTIAAAPDHPVFKRMVARILHSVDELQKVHDAPIEQLHPGSFEVMNSTGPAAWTDVVFEQLQEYDPSLTSLKDLSFMTAPKLYGDILVLTIDGFGMGQAHSHSTNDGTIPEAALMRHLFRGSWREPEPEVEAEDEG